MRAIDRWQSLNGREQWLTCVSALAVGTAALLMRVVSIQRLLRAASGPVSGSAISDYEIGDRIVAMDRAARYVPGATCLAKSLTLAWMLRGCGVPAEIRVGVQTADGFSAHAWVECEGKALTSAMDAGGTFTVVVSS